MKITACRCCREDSPSSIWRIAICLVLLACHILSVEGVCRAEDPNGDPNEDTYVSIPLALSVGDDKVLTEAFLKCRLRRYSLSVSEFLKTARDAEEKAMGKLFRFIQDEGQDSLPDDLLAADANQKTRKTALRAREVMGKFLPNTTVKAMVHVGENRVFIIEVADTRFARPGQDAGRLKFVMKSTDAGWRWDGFAKKDVLFSVILDSFIHEMNTDWVFSECREDLRFEYALPSTTKGSPVYLQFNGRQVDVDVFADDSSVPTNDSVMQFYVKAWQAFQDGHTESFLRYWDQASRAKFTKAMDMMPHFYDFIIDRGRHVWFVMEATPVSVVFTNPSAPRPRFNYVYKKPGSNRLELCGYNRFGFAEQFLASKETGQILKEAARTMLE